MKAYHLFISHSWTHADQYNNLVNLLDQANRFHYHNYSIPKDNPVHIGSDRELSEAIRSQMQPCGIVLVLAGVYASYSKWIDKEIKIAKSSFPKPKPILAIEPWGNERTSEAVKENANQIVGWNTKSIVAAIRDLA